MSGRLMQISVLGGWALFFGFLLQRVEGIARFQQFLNPSLAWLVVGGLLLALLMLGLTIFDESPQTLAPSSPAVLLVQTLIFLLPLIYFPMASSSHLSTDAFNNRFTGLPEEFPEVDMGPEKKTPGNDLFQELLAMGEEYSRKKEAEPARPTLRQLMTNPLAYRDKTVEVVGLVNRQPGFPARTFFIYRFFINCCAADALPVGVLVSYERPEALESGQWVRVWGTVRTEVKKKKIISYLVADRVENTDKPKMEYIFF